MVLSKEKAAAKYLAAIKALGGASAYYACGEEAATGGVRAVAECMKGLKKKVPEEAEKYALAYELA